MDFSLYYAKIASNLIFQGAIDDEEKFYNILSQVTHGESEGASLNPQRRRLFNDGNVHRVGTKSHKPES
jgi:hypothetical protein